MSFRCTLTKKLPKQGKYKRWRILIGAQRGLGQEPIILSAGVTNQMERYEITLDDEDVVMGEAHFRDTMARKEQLNNRHDLTNNVKTIHELKSTVMKRKGRGFEESSRLREDEDHLLYPEQQHYQQQHQEAINLAERSVEGWTLFIRNINEELTEEDLKDKLSDYGLVKDVKMALDHRTGYSKGYAIVEFREYREARAVIDSMDGKPFVGRPVKVDFCFLRSPSSVCE